MVFVKPGLSNYEYISETKECHSVSSVPLYVKTKQYRKVLVSAITCPARLWYGEEAKEGRKRNRHVQLRASSGHLSLQSDTFLPYIFDGNKLFYDLTLPLSSADQKPALEIEEGAIELYA